jgi:hypothetical protein
MREQRRREITRCRRRPAKPQRIYFPADGIGECIEVDPDKPIELCIEATDNEGKLVPWLTDEWWIRTHSFCKDRTVTIVILPTARSLLDSVVLHQLEMVRRIAPKWRIIGYAYATETKSESNAGTWASTPYDEIRFCENSAVPQNGTVERAMTLAAQAAALPPQRGQHHALLRMTRIMPYQVSESPAFENSNPEPQGSMQQLLANRQLSENVVQST